MRRLEAATILEKHGRGETDATGDAVVVATVAGTAAVATPLTRLLLLQLQLLVGVACGRAGVAHTAALRNRMLNSARGNLHGAASRTKKKNARVVLFPSPSRDGAAM